MRRTERRDHHHQYDALSPPRHADSALKHTQCMTNGAESCFWPRTFPLHRNAPALLKATVPLKRQHVISRSKFISGLGLLFASGHRLFISDSVWNICSDVGIITLALLSYDDATLVNRHTQDALIQNSMVLSVALASCGVARLSTRYIDESLVHSF